MHLPSKFQIVISNREIGTPSNWRSLRFSDDYFYFDMDFRVTHVTSRSGSETGILIGFPYDTNSRRFVESGQDKVILNSDDLNQVVEVTERFAGSYIFVHKTSHCTKLYMDHGGSIPIVYAADRGMAASTTSLILDDLEYESAFDHALYDAMVNRERTGGWISGTLTAHKGIKRLLPNHYLDLSTWSAKRFWPRPTDLNTTHTASTAAPAISEALAGFVGAAFEQLATSATLTAGYDTRMIMMAARDSGSRARFFTVSHAGAGLDVAVAQKLAGAAGFPHRVVEPVISTVEETEIWDRVVGHCVKESNRNAYKTLSKLAESNFILTGMYGEIGRCRLYRQDYEEINDKSLDEAFVVSRLTLPQYEPQNRDIRNWLDTLPGLPNAAVLDLAFWELKFGSWAMGQRAIQNSVKYALHPFSQRSILKLFLSLDPSEKHDGRLFDACISHYWPSLLETPINSYGDYRDQVAILKKLSNPNRIRRFLRDRLARARQ